jgi:hypothetical protein
LPYFVINYKNFTRCAILMMCNNIYQYKVGVCLLPTKKIFIPRLKFLLVYTFFNSVKLDPVSIDIMDIFQSLITRKGLVSKYFIQLLYFRKHNQCLFNVEIICAFQRRTSNFPILVYQLIERLTNANEDLPSKGSNIELSHFLSVNLHVITHVPRMLKKIENPINNSVKFPLSGSKLLQLIITPKHHPFKNGYKKQLYQRSSFRYEGYYLILNCFFCF